MTRYPAFRWRDAKEKEWAFRQLYDLGYLRGSDPIVNHAWDTLFHPPMLTGMMARFLDHSIVFVSMERPDVMYLNSGRHLVDHVRRTAQTSNPDA